VALDDRGMLDEALREATSAADAADAVVDALAEPGIALPSVYLARGGRLRLQAARGYDGVFDGLPPSAGVIGRTYRTGATAVVEDAAAEPGFLAVTDGVRGEVCVPVRCRDEVVGVVSLETRVPLRLGDVSRTERVTAQLGRALERLGHVAVETPAERLVRHAVRLGALTDPAAIRAETVAAACAVTGMDTAALFLPGPTGALEAGHAAGPLAADLGVASPAALRRVGDLVGSGASWWGLHPAAALPGAGRAGILMAVGVAAGAARRGLLLLADRQARRPPTELVELLELLAAQTAAALRTAAALSELRTRATTDPLTGLGHHATFHEALAAARAGGETLALLLADVDGFKTINDTRGHQAGDRVLRATAAALSGAMRRGDRVFRIGGDEFAAIVRAADDREAIAAGARLRGAAAVVPDVTVSVGVALPAPGEPDATLIARADAALYRVKGAGRDGVALAPAPA
jgi:diguanylate cyclase (GGDEF)-like protein